MAGSALKQEDTPTKEEIQIANQENKTDSIDVKYDADAEVCDFVVLVHL